MTLRYRRSKAAVERRVGGTLFLASPERGSLYRVNPTVSAFWTLLEKPASVAEAAAVFRRAFPDVSAKRIREDIETMVKDLLEEDLIVAVRSSPAKRANSRRR